MYMEGFTPAYQLQLLKKGHHLLPWLEWPPTDRDLDHTFKLDDPRRRQTIDKRMKYFETTIKELARLKLPISFLGTQWETFFPMTRNSPACPQTGIQTSSASTAK